MGTVFAGLRNLVSSFSRRQPAASREETSAIFRQKYNQFQSLLESNTELLKICSEIEAMLKGHEVFGMGFIHSRTSRAVFHVIRMIKSFESLSGRAQPVLLALVERLSAEIKTIIEGRVNPHRGRLVLALADITGEMVDQVGGKCANLGEIANRAGLPVPAGFSITTAAFRAFFEEAGLFETIASIRLGIAPDDPASMAAAAEDIQAAILRAPLPATVAREMEEAAARLRDAHAGPDIRFAMRSSAIGEDGELSFAGQYLTMWKQVAAGRAELHEAFAKALAAFKAGRFAEALEAFTPLADTDPAAASYVARCRRYLKNPPTSWRGVCVLTSK